MRYTVCRFENQYSIGLSRRRIGIERTDHSQHTDNGVERVNVSVSF